jgi:hypothetical protein
MKNLKMKLLLVVFIGLFSLALGETISFQMGDGGSYSTCYDTVIASGSPQRNHSTSEVLLVDAEDRNAGFGGDARVLICFPNIIGPNQGQVPPNASITSATLELTCYDPGTPAQVFRVTESWEIESVTWEDRGATLDNWTTPGGTRNSSPDYDYRPPVGVVRLDITASVKVWVANPDLNYGIIIIADSTRGTGGSDYRSSEYPTLEERPKLIVEFTPLSASKQSWGKVKEMFK